MAVFCGIIVSNEINEILERVRGIFNPANRRSLNLNNTRITGFTSEKNKFVPGYRRAAI